MIDPFVVLGFNVSTKHNKMYNCFSTTRCRQSITFAIFVLRLVFIPLASFFSRFSSYIIYSLLFMSCLGGHFTTIVLSVICVNHIIHKLKIWCPTFFMCSGVIDSFRFEV